MISAVIKYKASSVDEFKDLLLWAKENGIPNSPALTMELKGPKELEFRSKTGERLRFSKEEMKSGLSREEVAQQRLIQLEESGHVFVGFTKQP